MAIDDREIWRVGRQRLTALGEIARRNERRKIGGRDPGKSGFVFTECKQRDRAHRNGKSGDRGERDQ